MTQEKFNEMVHALLDFAWDYEREAIREMLMTYAIKHGLKTDAIES